MTHSTNWLWQEQMFVWSAYLYYVADDSHWRDMTYDAHVEWLNEHQADWTEYIKSRLPDDHDPAEPLHTFGHGLKWTEQDAVDAIDWRDKFRAGTWYETQDTVASNDVPVYTGIQLEGTEPIAVEAIVTDETEQTEAPVEAPVKAKRTRRTKAEIAAARAAIIPQQEAAPEQEPVAEPAPSGDSTGMHALVEKYITLRDRRDTVMREAKEKAAKFDTVLDKIEAVILATFDDVGVDSVKTGAGTAYKSKRTSAKVADWDTVLHYIAEHGLWNMLERRVAKVAVEEYKDAHGELPPGVDWREEITINVRRS